MVYKGAMRDYPTCLCTSPEHSFHRQAIDLSTAAVFLGDNPKWLQAGAEFSLRRGLNSFCIDLLFYCGHK
ncbi:MAG: hypothetical protein ABSG12_06190, partial [Steroidobacteraceae bacterium]